MGQVTGHRRVSQSRTKLDASLQTSVCGAHPRITRQHTGGCSPISGKYVRPFEESPHQRRSHLTGTVADILVRFLVNFFLRIDAHIQLKTNYAFPIQGHTVSIFPLSVITHSTDTAQ